MPTYEEAIRASGSRRATACSSVGCGSGVFLRVAADRGAARRRPRRIRGAARARPRARARGRPAAGRHAVLPYEDDAFDMVAALQLVLLRGRHRRRRCARPAGSRSPGAPVVIQVWGRPRASDLAAMKRALAAVPPAADPRAPPGPPAAVAARRARGASPREAGLRAGAAFDVSLAVRLPRTRTRWCAALLSRRAGRRRRAEARRGTAAGRLVDALAPYRTPSGGYRLANEWHFLIARA